MSTKALDLHVDNLKILGDTIQVITLPHSNFIILVFIVTNSLGELPNFDEIDEHFSCKHFFVPQNSVP